MDPDEPDAIGGAKSLPPPELGLYTWVEEATKLVKAKYSDAQLKNVTAKKVRGGLRKDYDLSFSGEFRVQSSNVVTVTGDKKTISNPEQVSLGLGDVKDMSQVTAKIYAEMGPNSSIPSIKPYEEFFLFRPIPKSTDKPPRPDQPYYRFSDKNGDTLATVGAKDGKVYKL